MLHPYAAAPGELPAAAKAQLETAAGTTLTLTGTTRTGALELALPGPVSDAGAKALVKQAARQIAACCGPKPSSARPPRAPCVPRPPKTIPRGACSCGSTKAQSVTPDFLDRMSTLVGTKLSLVRQIGNVYVLETISDQSVGTMRTMAELLQTQPEVKYADPVRRAAAFAVPNDPMFPLQWSLFSAKAGVNAETAWTLQPSTHDIVVAVVDTGILPHPDLDGRVLPGYDFISDAGRARDGNARDPDPRDEGDWSDGDCFGAAVRQLLPRHVRGGDHRGQDQQRHRHRGSGGQRQDPSGARARQVRRHLRGHPRRRDVGIGHSHRRRSRQQVSGQGDQPEPGRLRCLRPVVAGSDRRRDGARRGDRGRRRQRVDRDLRRDSAPTAAA